MTLFPALRVADVPNKFHEGNGEDGRHYWLTPPDLYARLDALNARRTSESRSSR